MSINCKDWASLFFFLTQYLHTKDHRVARESTHLKGPFLTNCILKKSGEEERKQNRKPEERKGKKKVLLNIHGFPPLPPRARPQQAGKLAICGAFAKEGGAQAESRKSLLPTLAVP